MPWCHPCGTFIDADKVPESGQCPTCGGEIGQPVRTVEGTNLRFPWHFWLLVVAATVYLVWRLIDGIALLF